MQNGAFLLTALTISSPAVLTTYGTLHFALARIQISVLQFNFLSHDNVHCFTPLYVGAFWMYAIFAFMGFLWMWYALPETKGLSLEQITGLFTYSSELGDGHRPSDQTGRYMRMINEI